MLGCSGDISLASLFDLYNGNISTALLPGWEGKCVRLGDAFSSHSFKVSIMMVVLVLEYYYNRTLNVKSTHISEQSRVSNYNK